MKPLVSRLVAATLLFAPALVVAQAPSNAPSQALSLPLRQSQLDSKAADPKYRVPLDSTSDARWLGGGASLPRWSVDGEWFYFQFALQPKPIEGASAPDDPWWKVSKDGKRVESVARREIIALPNVVQYTRDLGRAVWFAQNELKYWKRGGVTRVLLGRDQFINPQWTEDERAIRWTESNNLFELEPESGTLRQLTKAVVQTEPPRPDKVKDELKKNQQELFDFVKRQMAIRDSSAKLALADAAWKPITTPYKTNDVISSLHIPVTGKYVTYLVTPRVTQEQTHFSEYVNESGIVVDRTSRAKVGAPIAVSRAAIVTTNSLLHPDSVKVTYVDTAGLGKASLPMQLSWNPQGTRLAAEFQSTDYKDRWIVLIDPATGKRTKQLHHLHDDAWIGGAGQAPGRLFPSWMQWLPDGETLAFTSEESGWAHLYTVSMDGTKKQLTSGNWEVRSVSLSRDRTRWWIGAGIEHPNEMHLYEVPLAGGTPRCVDQLGEGELTPVLSPDQSVVAARFTSPNALPDIYVMPANGGSSTQVTRSGTDAFWRIAWLSSDFVRFPDGKGAPVFARVFRPRSQHPNKPAVLEIHGAGYAQGVHKAFGNSSAHGGRLYAQYLAERGVTYMILDYRGSAGYGRDMRTDIYRTMGDRDVGSAIAAIPFLQQKYNVNPAHIGLYGCSYGGFFTLMALFKHPGTFQAGGAQCSVTDWAHYNDGYTARILNGAPVSDTTAYKASSPIWHAKGLKDKLLLQHGLVDDNVQYQDAVRLVQRLMELGKDFEFVTYPVEAHGWQTRWSRMDSQRRLTKLWEETLLKR